MLIIKKLFVRCCLSLIVSGFFCGFFCGFLSAQEKVTDKSQSEGEKKAVETSQSVKSTEAPVKQSDQQQKQSPQQDRQQQNQQQQNQQQQSQPKKVAQQPTFDIIEYRVKGNSVLPGKTIELVLTPFLGPQKTLDVIEKAADALERAYRDNGYPAVYVNIPPQDVVGGIVYLDAVEGKIARLKITESDYFALSEIKGKVSSLSEDEALHLPSLQKDINHLNSLSADLNVIPILKPGKLPGTLDVELKVRDRLPVHGDITLNNHHSKNTTETRLGASLRYDNLWQKQHGLGLQVQVSPEDTSEVRVFSGTYIMPWRQTNNRMVFYAVRSDSESEVASVGAEGDGLLVIGDSSIVGFRFVKPLESSAKYVHSLSLGFDYKDVLENVEFQGTDTDDLVTPITYNVWTAQYNATRRTKHTTTRYGLGINFGIQGLGNSVKEFEDKRFNGEPDFFYLLGNYRRQDFFSGDWSLTSRIRVQFANSPLVSNEQIRAGGATSVRGYFESQQGADRGFLIGFELQSPSFLTKNSKHLQALRAVTFLEGSSLEIVEPLPDQIEHFELAGFGLGLRIQAWKKFNFNFDWALPLKEDCSEPGCIGETDIDNNNIKFIFNMSYQF